MPPTFRTLMEANRELRRPFPAALSQRVLGAEEQVLSVFLYLGQKVLGLQESVLHLCERKMDTEAAMLSRPLFEAAVTTGWLARDPEERLPMFYASSIYAMRRMNSKVSKHAEIFPVAPEQVMRLAREWLAKGEKEIIARFGRVKPSSWGPVSFSEMASDVGATHYYDIVYGLLSDLEHSGPAGMMHYVRTAPDGTTATVPVGVTSWTTGTLQLVHPLTLLALATVDAVLDLGQKEHLDACQKRWGEILPKR